MNLLHKIILICHKKLKIMIQLKNQIINAAEFYYILDRKKSKFPNVDIADEKFIIKK